MLLFMTNLLRFCQEAFIKSWWVYLFFLLCYMLYEQGLRTRSGDFEKLSLQLELLQREQKEVMAKQEELLLQINSQSDPAWVELTLMKGLGLVPEGATKFYFFAEP